MIDQPTRLFVHPRGAMISIQLADSICRQYGADAWTDRGLYYVIHRGSETLGRTMITDDQVARHAVELILGKD